ncbi:hypothetical protein HAX54_008848 [Datura stramonium]|uniref:Uncharacterized protein n=1 Tax=Datura stramonium TaxID=4076 RepID=A0ABS8RVS6_DATST|nr:hypothetical protein [Datura stramonium]
MGQETQNEDASMPQQPPQGYGLHWLMEQEGIMWFKETRELKYSHELRINRDSLAFEFPQMIDRIHTLRLDFVFKYTGECNLNLVGEFLANWEPKERTKQGCIEESEGEKGADICFWGLLIRFLREGQIEEEVFDYRPRYDPKGIDVKKKKELEGLGSALSRPPVLEPAVCRYQLIAFRCGSSNVHNSLAWHLLNADAYLWSTCPCFSSDRSL